MQFISSFRVCAIQGAAGFKFGEQHPGGGLRWRSACAGLVFVVACTCFAQEAHRTVATVPPAAPSSSQSSSVADTKGSADHQEKAKPQSDAGAGAQSQAPAENQRQQQISAESTQLLAMAEALKAEVDKTDKDTLSLNVIRKADAIEKLAKTVKEKMKQNPAPN